jgi:hypothetical protein
MSRITRRRIAALALGALLLAPWAASAAPPWSSPKPPGLHRIVQDSAGLVSRFWGALKAIWAENGCTIDPDGARCASSTNGGTIPVSLAPEGCTIDPDGRCASSR